MTPEAKSARRRLKRRLLVWLTLPLFLVGYVAGLAWKALYAGWSSSHRCVAALFKGEPR